MAFFFAFLLAAFLGYLYGYYIRPNQKLRKAVEKVKAQCVAALEEGRKGVYKTIVTDQQNASELVVEVKELALTQGGQVKVQYLNAFYKNPEFRTRKGEALLQEVRGLLGEYLPASEVEWYETEARHARIRELVQTIDPKHSTHLS
ncbi:hypothetical protein EFA69_13810 [Rufibacter immobilis]|uniref:Uncharacterized protein n=1 Tax=Rufibacter immobilis TaxID=1348778 RepID=A0A3M9MNV8_9BACT|nr:hypothetical protein [Rufibacter immobilis]RNI27232.1 hypothetical protein EFA69_13810 [Rufibacter immobilis]